VFGTPDKEKKHYGRPGAAAGLILSGIFILGILILSLAYWFI
jgi:hypothetical protein